MHFSLSVNVVPGKSGKCGPPPDIENGDILSFPKSEYSQGETLQYKCPNLYILEGSSQIRCINGQWTNPPVCLGRFKACAAWPRAVLLLTLTFSDPEGVSNALPLWNSTSAVVDSNKSSFYLEGISSQCQLVWSPLLPAASPCLLSSTEGGEFGWAAHVRRSPSVCWAPALRTLPQSAGCNGEVGSVWMR